MSSVRSALLALVSGMVLLAHPAQAQTNCVPNPNATAPMANQFVNGCSLPAASLNNLGVAITPQLYGAKGDGVTDDSTAINTAIAAAASAPSGGIVYIPPRVYAIAHTINIGNGSVAAASTVNGVVLQGLGVVGSQLFGFPATVNSKPQFTWTGGPSAPMINILGPLQGWGVQNLVLNCNSVTGSIGVGVVSGQLGVSKGLTINNCAAHGVLSTTVTAIPPGLSNADSFHNEYDNLTISVPNIVGANGITLTSGNNSVAADTDFASFRNTTIAITGTNATGVYLQNCDDNNFLVLHVGGTGTAIKFDYTQSGGAWPAGNTIDHVDYGTNTVVNVGNPGGSIPGLNYMNNLSTTNGSTYPNLRGLMADHAIGTWTPVLAGVSGTPTYQIQVGTYEVNGYVVTAHFNVETLSLGGLAGTQMVIQGLPFTVSGTTNEMPGFCSISRMTLVTLTASYTVLTADPSAGNSWINLLQNGSGQALMPLPASGLADGALVEGACTYRRLP